jgi:hypothetical protein
MGTIFKNHINRSAINTSGVIKWEWGQPSGLEAAAIRFLFARMQYHILQGLASDKDFRVFHIYYMVTKLLFQVGSTTDAKSGTRLQ